MTATVIKTRRLRVAITTLEAALTRGNIELGVYAAGKLRRGGIDNRWPSTRRIPPTETREILEVKQTRPVRRGRVVKR